MKAITWTWTVFYGPRNACKVFYTEYHAKQFARAMSLNGTPATIISTQQA